MTISMSEPVTLDAGFPVSDIIGRWRMTEAAEVFPDIYGIDDFWIQSPFWGIHFNAYADADCTVRLFELINMGTFVLRGESTAVPGARDGDFSRIKTSLTLYSPDLVTVANEAGSGNGDWQLGQWQDVSFGGCLPIDLPGIDTCPLEYDLLGLARAGTPDGSGDRLYFGQRHHDADGAGICQRRSPGLLPFYVTRVVGAPPTAGDGAGWGPADWTELTSTVIPRIEGPR